MIPAGHANAPVFDLWVKAEAPIDSRGSETPTCCKLALRGQDRDRRSNRSNCCRGLLTQHRALLSQCVVLDIGELHPTVNLAAQDAIFCP
jgi:hypothetical protein